MPKTLISGALIYPVTSGEAKSHLRIAHSDDDTYINNLIAAATEYVEEDVLCRALISQTWDYYLNDFPSEDIELPLGQLQSVSYIKYSDTDGTQSTFPSGEYSVDTISEPGRIVLNYGKTWPTEQLAPLNPIVIRFVCGYGDAITDIPEKIRQGILVTIADMYELRESISENNLYCIPAAADRLLMSYRMFLNFE